MSAQLSPVQAEGPRQTPGKWRERAAWLREAWGGLRQALHRALPLSWLILLAWGAWRLEPFYRVGMASQDQVNFSLQATDDFWHGVLDHAKAQGRIYFLFTKIVDLWLAARPEVWRVHAINLLVFALSAPCFAYAVFRCRAQRWLYIWLFASVAWASYHHMPPAAYPSVNHLPFLLWALAAYLVRRKSARGGERNWGTVVAFGVLAFVALFQYEPVAAMSLCIFGWLAYAEPPALRRRLTVALGGAAISYLAAYVAWRMRFPTTYDGAMAGSLSLWKVLKVIVAYTVGGLPFCGAYSDSLPLRFGDRRVGEAFLHLPPGLTPPPSALGVLLTTLAVFGLFYVYARGVGSVRPAPVALDRRLRLGLWALPVVLLLAINGLLGLSVKYQEWVRDWDETYLTSQLALYPLVLLGTLVLATAYRFVRVRGVPFAFGALTLAVATLSLPVYAHNQRITSLQRANLARWEEVTALASYASHIEQPFILAPDLYSSIFIGERDWTRYWGRYVQQRFGGWLSFLARAPEGRNNFARVLPYRFEDGRLRAISVQTDDYVAIVARSENAPCALISAGGRALPLDWSDAEILGRSGYSAVTLSEPPELLGSVRQIEPVWVWPQTQPAAPR